MGFHLCFHLCFHLPSCRTKGQFHFQVFGERRQDAVGVWDRLLAEQSQPEDRGTTGEDDR